MKKAHYLIVDMDDTLIMTTAANNMAYIEAIKHVLDINLYPLNLHNIRLTNEVITHVFFGLSPCQQREIKAQKDKLYIEYLSNTDVNYRAIEEIRKYKDAIIVLLTNATEERAETTLSYHKLEELFHHRLYNEGKDPNKFQYFLDTMKVHPVDCYILENDSYQIDQALKAGIPSSQIIKIQ